MEPSVHPGRRTIYDAAFKLEGRPIGVDFRTKDLADNRFSDGGICAVGNLLRWLVNERGTLLITEFGYRIESGTAAFEYVATAPIHTLPAELYRIENLGTGQVRLNESVKEALQLVVWERSTAEFLDSFAELCIAHYERVQERAAERVAAIERFVEGGFSRIALK